jgi:dihydroxyacetone kinase-like predicted kinase
MLDQYKETRWSDHFPKNEELLFDKVPERELYLNKVPGTAGSSDSLIGVVTVLSGEGLYALFTALGVDKIVSGGQSMNPSVKEIMDAISEIEAEKIIILPNNRNIRLSALQASELVEKEVLVVDTKSVPEGLAALLALDRNKALKDNFTEMNIRARQIKTGEVTYATRDTVVNDLPVKKGNIIGICDGRLTVSDESVDSATLKLVRFLLTGDEEIITLFSGKEIKDEEAEKLVGNLRTEFPGIEIELRYGGQPLYYYLISVE